MTAFGSDSVTAEARPVASSWDRVRRHPAGNVTIVFVVFLSACVIVGLLYPDDFRFMATPNLKILMRAIPTLGLLALGAGILMIAGEFDLSIGALFTFAPYMMALSWINGAPEIVAVGAALATAVGIGLINGYVTLRFGIPSFITTLGMLFMIRSGSRIVTGYKALIFRADPVFDDMLTITFYKLLPVQFLWFLAFAVVAYFILNKHRLGNRFYAVGGNREAAVAVGINVFRTKMIAFVLCSVFASIAGIISVTRQHSATVEPQYFLELEAIAICVMGGVVLTGGRGAILGIVLGTLILQMVKDVLILSQAPGFYLDVFIGMVIVVAVILNTWAAKRY